MNFARGVNFVYKQTMQTIVDSDSERAVQEARKKCNIEAFLLSLLLSQNVWFVTKISVHGL